MSYSEANSVEWGIQGQRRQFIGATEIVHMLMHPAACSDFIMRAQAVEDKAVSFEHPTIGLKTGQNDLPGRNEKRRHRLVGQREHPVVRYFRENFMERAVEPHESVDVDWCAAFEAHDGSVHNCKIGGDLTKTILVHLPRCTFGDGRLKYH